MNNHNFNESLINNLTIAEKVHYGFIAEDIADTVIESKNAIDILENYNLDLNNGNCIGELISEIVIESKQNEIEFLEYLLDTILDSEKEDSLTLNDIQKALENKISVLSKDI